MKWKNGLTALAVVLAGVGMVAAPMDVEARRLGGGRPAGMQRQVPAKQPSATPNQSPNQAPNQQQNAAPAQQPGQPAAPAAQPGKRSWLGPIAGIAAGLGIAALMSHLGMGEAFGNVMTMALLALVAFMVIGWIMRRMRGGPQLAGAGAPYGGGQAGGYSPPPVGQQQPVQRQAPGQAPLPGSFGAAGDPPLAQAMSLPPGFDVQDFTRVAKMIFIRMQAANDAANIEDLRKFTTPELFASLRLDIQERGQAPNQTDVMQLDAELADAAQEHGQWVVSVRFHGLIREEAHAGAQPFNELWHLVKPVQGTGDWAIAGIMPLEA